MSVEDININSHTCYFFDNIINIKEFDPHNIKIDDKSHKNILIYYTVQVMARLPWSSANPIPILNIKTIIVISL